MSQSSRQGASEGKPSRFLEETPAESEIQAFNAFRIRSRSEKKHFREHMPKRSKLSASNLGDVFEADESIFRNSLAFHYPSALTSRPFRREVNQLWRNSIKAREYE
jgi:hypothetical protein